MGPACDEPSASVPPAVALSESLLSCKAQSGMGGGYRGGGFPSEADWGVEQRRIGPMAKEAVGVAAHCLIVEVLADALGEVKIAVGRAAPYLKVEVLADVLGDGKAAQYLKHCVG